MEYSAGCRINWVWFFAERRINTVFLLALGDPRVFGNVVVAGDNRESNWATRRVIRDVSWGNSSRAWRQRGSGKSSRGYSNGKSKSRHSSWAGYVRGYIVCAYACLFRVQQAPLNAILYARRCARIYERSALERGQVLSLPFRFFARILSDSSLSCRLTERKQRPTAHKKSMRKRSNRDEWELCAPNRL